jgi:GDP-mannose 6-dehydrogenase
MILAGTDDPAAAAVVRTMYLDVRAPFVHTSVRTAELVKVASDAYDGLAIGFASEIPYLASALGVDGHAVMRIFTMDRKLVLESARACGRRP